MVGATALPERCPRGWPWVHRDGPMAAGSAAGSGAGFGMSQACRASGNPCHKQDYVIATPGLWFPASNPAASPSSRRSKLKGRFMLSDPWGGGRLNAGIEAWHGSALLRWSRQPAAWLPGPAAARCRSSPGCAGAMGPRQAHGHRGHLAARGRELLTLSATGRTGCSGGGEGWAAVPGTGCGAPARLCAAHKSSDSCWGAAAPAPLRQNGLQQERGAHPSPGTPPLWHLTPSSLRGRGDPAVLWGHRSCAGCVPRPPHLAPPWGLSQRWSSRWHHQARGSCAPGQPQQPGWSQRGATVPPVPPGVALGCGGCGALPTQGTLGAGSSGCEGRQEPGPQSRGSGPCSGVAGIPGRGHGAGGP